MDTPLNIIYPDGGITGDVAQRGVYSFYNYEILEMVYGHCNWGIQRIVKDLRSKGTEGARVTGY